MPTDPGTLLACRGIFLSFFRAARRLKNGCRHLKKCRLKNRRRHLKNGHREI